MPLRDLPENYRPIVQGIDRPDRADKPALIYETKVGAGHLLVCTLDLQNDLDKRPVARQLRRSLLDYAASSDFNPSAEISLKGNLPVTSHRSVLGHQTPKVTADSVAEGFPAGASIDNDMTTFWQTRWDATATPPPHQITFELKAPLEIKGFLYTPRQDSDQGRIAQYRIEISDDGKMWKKVADGVWPNNYTTQSVELHSPVTTRFIRLTGLSEVKGRPAITVAEFDVILNEAKQ
jgi:hypothetical protein